MEFKFATGGREKYFKVNIHSVRDCCCRAIANATGIDYLEVYNGLNEWAKNERTGKRKRGKSSARNGCYNYSVKKYLEETLGWVWVPCMFIGSGCQVHLDANELPSGNLVVDCSKHLTCVRDGVIYDTYDCSRNENRCVYGYWREPTAEEKEMHDAVMNQKAEYKAFCEQQKKDLAQKRAEVKKHNDKVKKQYATKINKLRAQLRKLEKERDSKMLPTPQAEKDAWAKHCISKEWDENGEYDREGMC